MSLYRRSGSPHWWVRISIAGRKTRRSTGTDDRTQAEEFEQRERERLWRLRRLKDRSAALWQEATTRYLAESARPRTRDREIIERLSRQLDNEPIYAIDTDAIENLRKILRKDGLAPSTVDRFMRTVRAVLRSCVRWQLIPAAPTVPMYNAAAPEPKWLTHAQFEALKAELPRHLQLAARFAVLTGLRMRSQLGLTWDRVDLQARRLWIPGEQMKAGRTHGLPLSREATQVLEEIRALKLPGPYVFQYEHAVSPTVKRWERLRECNTKAFKKAAERAGVMPLRWHDLRHTFAAWAVQSGVTLQELMLLGGWSSHRMALRYSHLAPDHLAEAAEKISTKGTKRAQQKRNRKVADVRKTQ